MKNKFFIAFMFLLLSFCAFADEMLFDKDKVILEGLGKKSLKTRLKYIELAKHSDSKAVFEKLREMYRVNNIIKDDVFYAMKWMNAYNKGVFSEAFAASMKEEFERLKNLNWANRPQIFYLQVCLSIIQDQLYPGFDGFVEEISKDIDKTLENSSHERIDPVKLKAEILGECIFYFAKRNRSGYMQKLAEVFMKNEISEQASIIELFTEKKDPTIFGPLSNFLSNDENIDTHETLFELYESYAKTIGKDIPQNIQKSINKLKLERQKNAKELLKDY